MVRFIVLATELGHNVRNFENNLLPGQKDDGTFFRGLAEILSRVQTEKESILAQNNQRKSIPSTPDIDYKTYKISFGKYKKTKPTITEIADSDLDYYKWMKETITSEPLVSIIEAYEKNKETSAEIEEEIEEDYER